MTHAGVAPDLVEEVGWWRVNDLWFYATAAFVIYVRAAAEHAGRSVRDVCEEMARTHGIDLDHPPEVSPRRRMTPSLPAPSGHRLVTRERS
jgi:hypothetical protein